MLAIHNILSLFARYMLYDGYFSLAIGRDYADIHLFFRYFSCYTSELRLEARKKDSDNAKLKKDIKDLKKDIEDLNEDINNFEKWIYVCPWFEGRYVRPMEVQRSTNQEEAYKIIEKIKVAHTPIIDGKLISQHNNIKTSVINPFNLDVFSKDLKDVMILQKEWKNYNINTLLSTSILIGIVALDEFQATVWSKNGEGVLAPAVLVPALNEFYNGMAHIVAYHHDPKLTSNLQHATRHFCKMARLCYSLLLRLGIEAKLGKGSLLDDYRKLRESEYLSLECDDISVAIDYKEAYDELSNMYPDTIAYSKHMTKQYNDTYLNTKTDVNLKSTSIPLPSDAWNYLVGYYDAILTQTFNKTANHDPFFAQELHYVIGIYHAIINNSKDITVDLVIDNYVKNKDVKTYDSSLLNCSELKGFVNLYFQLYAHTKVPIRGAMYEFNKIMSRFIVCTRHKKDDKHKKAFSSHIARALKDLYKFVIKNYFLYIRDKNLSYNSELLQSYSDARLHEILYFGNQSEKGQIPMLLKPLAESILNDRNFCEYLKDKS